MATEWQTLTQQRADLVAASLAVVDAAEQEHRAFTTVEQRQLEANEAELAQLAPRLAAVEARRERERNVPAPDAARPGGPPRSARYADLFGRGALNAGGWGSFNDYLSALDSGRFHPGLVPISAVATGGVGADGGFLVPTEYAAGLLDAALEDEIVRSRAEVWPMASDTRKVAGFDSSSAADGTLFGALTGQWVEQGAEISPQTPQLRFIDLHVRKLAALTEVSNELVADGQNYEQQLGQALVKAISWHLDFAFLRGSGSGQPLGVLNSPVTISVAKESNQAADTITFTNLSTMFSRLHPSCVKNAIFLASPTCIPQLLTLSIAIGTSGAHIPVMSETNGQLTVLTRPIVFTEKLPPLGDSGDILLADFSQYVIGLRQELVLDKSSHAGFTRDTSHYRCIIRADGQPKWSSAYTPRNGSTLSPFVKLDAR